MGIRTEAWWVCNVCKTKIQRVGGKSRSKKISWDEHRKVCPKATGSIKQVPQ